MVIRPKSDTLIAAADLHPRFLRLETESVNAAIPALPGWHAVRTVKDGAEQRDPVLAWMMIGGRFGVPIVCEPDSGVLTDLDDAGPYRLVGPDDAPTA
jgi:hypothetical protein